MLPIKLELCGIHSFKTEQSIDFSKINGSFFGIFGATGSGKSTILDAITLALYGKVQRAKVSFDFINLSSNKAWVRFCFEASANGKVNTYLIERNFKRKKDNRQVESLAVVYIKQGNSFNVCAEGVFDCDAYIKNLLGLGFEEFSKCIALPQGQFADFLKSTPNERTGLISNVFDLQAYGAPLYENAREKEQSLKEKIAEINGKLAELADINEDNLKSVEKRLNEANGEISKLETQLEEISKKFDESKQVYFKQNQLQKAKDRAETLKLQSDTMRELEERLERIKLAMPLSKSLDELTPLLVEVKKLQMQFEESKQNLSRISEEYDLVKKEFDEIDNNFSEKYNSGLKRIHYLNELKLKEIELLHLKEERQKIKDECDSDVKTKEELEERKARLEKNASVLEKDEQNIELVLKDLEVDSAIVSQVKKGVELQSQIEILDKLAGNFNHCLEQKRKELNQLETKCGELEREINANKQALDDEVIGIDAGIGFKFQIQTQLEQEKTSELQLENVKIALEIIDELIASFKKDRDNLETSQNEIEQKVNELVRKQKDRDEEIKVAKNYYNKLMKSREQGLVGVGAFYIYKDAKMNEPCPVCSQNINSKVQIPDLPQEVSQNQVENAFNDLIKANEGFNQTSIELESGKCLLDEIIKSIEQVDAQIKLLTQKYNALLNKFVSPYETDDINTKIAKKHKKCDNFIQILQKIDDLMQKNYDLEKEKANCLGQIVSLKTEITDFENQLSEIYSLKNERKQIIVNLEKRFGGQSLFVIKSAIDANLEKTEIQIKKKEEITKNIQSLKNEIANASNKILEVSMQVNLKNQKLTENQKVIDAILEVLEKESKENSISSICEEEERAVENLERKHKELKIKLENVFQSKVSAESELKLNTSKVKEKLEAFETKNAQFETQLKEKGFRDVETLRSFVCGEQVVLEIQEKLNNYASEKGLVRAEIEHLTAELEGVLINTEDMAELELKIGEIKTKIDSLRIEIGKYQGEVERIGGKLTQKQELSDLLTSFESDLNYAKELVRVLRGKALAQYVCDEYIEEITLRANNTAQLLLDGKYTLKFKEGEFIVEDNLNSAEPRAVSTLSGGETFLISLSLALSISETIATMSGKNIDFLFLDEGFGTLDNELCETVVGALYKLESKNLKIGVISHVELLYEKIKNKIIVSKSEEEGSVVKLEFTL